MGEAILARNASGGGGGVVTGTIEVSGRVRGLTVEELIGAENFVLVPITQISAYDAIFSSLSYENGVLTWVYPQNTNSVNVYAGTGEWGFDPATGTISGLYSFGAGTYRYAAW